MPSSLSCLPVDVELDASNVVGEKLTWRWLVTHRAKRRPIGVEVSRRRLENIEVIRESRDAGDEQSLWIADLQLMQGETIHACGPAECALCWILSLAISSLSLRPASIFLHASGDNM
jgi:hypothetical protein